MTTTSTAAKSYTTRQVAEMFKVSRHAVYKWRTAGKINCTTDVNGEKLFTAATIEAFAATRVA